MTKQSLILVAMAVLLWSCFAGSAGVVKAGTAGRNRVTLPVLAVVTGNEAAAGKTWMQEGLLGGSLDVARREFKQSMRAGGWTLDKTISMGTVGQRSELSIWIRRGHRVLLMIAEREPGVCGFTWGEELN